MGKFLAYNDIRWPEHLIKNGLTKAIENEDLLYTSTLDNFDREGFELLPIEQEYYKANGITLFNKEVLAKESGNPDGWSAAVQQWMYVNEVRKHFFLDHSYCCARFKFEHGSPAYLQLEKVSKERPELIKLLRTKEKFGLDFCLDWIDGQELIEMAHIELDFYNYRSFQYEITKLQNLFSSHDWNYMLKELKHNYFHLSLMDSERQADYKAAFFGLSKASRILKSF